MSFSLYEIPLNRLRCRQWAPLKTQQLRLRHVSQILAYNITIEKSHSYYFTFHLTSLSAPFYTSEKIYGPNLKWMEIDMRSISCTSISSLVLRIWQHTDLDMDKIILTWGINLSGLVHIGNRLADIQPTYFNKNTVIFSLQGSYFTSLACIRKDLKKPLPFKECVNVLSEEEKIFRRTKIKASRSEINSSYDLEKLRKLQSLQVDIRNKLTDVQIIKEKIDKIVGLHNSKTSTSSSSSFDPSSTAVLTKVRYEPQLLTMNSLNKLLQDKPTNFQKQQMINLSKEIELSRFRSKLLSHERDKKSALIRKLKQRNVTLLEENEEKNFKLMECYHNLSKDKEKFKEYRRSLLHHRGIYRQISSQTLTRQWQLMRELLFIYPVERCSGNKYAIHDIILPNSDVIADCADIGFSVALGYVTHILIMCSTFLQVPLRYPLVHCGSRSYIIDNISPLLPDRERDFPLFTKGREKMQFTYAVYLLNQNLAQLRWLFHMETPDLKPTLSNLLHFLQGPKDKIENYKKLRIESIKSIETLCEIPTSDDSKKISPSSSLIAEKFVSLASYGSNSSICDPILDTLRQENKARRSSSPTRRPVVKSAKACENVKCGRGLSEILAIPEAFLNRQMSSDSFKSYMSPENLNAVGQCCGQTTHGFALNSNSPSIIENIDNPSCDKTKNNMDLIEEGTDPLDSSVDHQFSSKSIKIHSESQLRNKNIEGIENRPISRSMGSYTDDEGGVQLRTSFELGSEPLLNVSCDIIKKISENNSELPKSLEENHVFLEKWIDSGTNLICPDETLYPEEFLGTTSNISIQNNPLTARANALIKTSSFNLVKPK